MYAANVGRATIMDEQNTVPEVSKNVKIQKDVQAMVCVCSCSPISFDLFHTFYFVV